MAVDTSQDFLYCTRPVMGIAGIGHRSADEPDGVFRFQGASANQAAAQHQQTQHGILFTLDYLLMSGLIKLAIGTRNYGIRTGSMSGLIYYPGSSLGGQSTSATGEF